MLESHAGPGPLQRAPGGRLPVAQHGPACAGAVARLPALCAGNPALVRSAVIRAVLPAIFAGNRAAAMSQPHVCSVTGNELWRTTTSC